MSGLREELDRLDSWVQFGSLLSDLDPFFEEMEREALKRKAEVEERLAVTGG